MDFDVDEDNEDHGVHFLNRFKSGGKLFCIDASEFSGFDAFFSLFHFFLTWRRCLARHYEEIDMQVGVTQEYRERTDDCFCSHSISVSS